MFSEKEKALIGNLIGQALHPKTVELLSLRDKLALDEGMGNLSDEEKTALVELIDGIRQLSGTPQQMLETSEMIVAVRNTLTAPQTPQKKKVVKGV